MGLTHMTSSGSQLDRAHQAKQDDEWESPIMRLKLVLIGIQLTLIGGIVDEFVFVLMGGTVSVVGLVIE